MLDLLDKKIIAALQGDFPLTVEPYRAIADSLQISEDELLARLQKYKENGQMRKLGAVLKHREVGYAANALCAWNVPDERQEEIGKVMIDHPAVTHCYGRNSAPDWPYNFYTMLHAHDREACCAIAAELAQNARIPECIMLFSTKEWKKTSMRYFQEAEEK
ncbi:DNA-binding Lrp family transcriptional regulator [Anaerospora hongkongensis]|uniref:siroheme decarboxylase n=1 Tax=Anaerospora hongkongensis TaxID=244830 RepID=A0A4R1PXK3_9FIRM|nr:AsnC family transcriptional regulator [Anaerospora hongkongensis]TCL36534.1 DNA-binding Lrp family transcriptional regulator [Anaerospora hongkongensis]